MTPQRTLLCRTRTFMGNEAAFLTADGLDVDAAEHYDVVRRRVIFDDIHLVTLHTDRGVAYLIVTGLFGCFFLALSIFIVSLSVDAWPAALPLFLMGIFPFVAFVLRLAMGRSVVSVFGRRSKAILRFGTMRTNKARNVYGQICAAVRRAQSASAVSDAGSSERPLPAGVPLPPPAQSHFPPQ